MLPKLPLTLLHAVGGGRLGCSILPDGARAGDRNVRQHHKSQPVAARVPYMRRIVPVLSAHIRQWAHALLALPLDVRIIKRVIDRPLVARLPLWLLLAVLLYPRLRLLEDADRMRIRSHKVEAGTDGGAPLFDHRERPSPDTLADDISVSEERFGRAEEDRVEIDEENVQSALEHAQPEALPLADHIELGDGDGIGGDAR